MTAHLAQFGEEQIRSSIIAHLHNPARPSPFTVESLMEAAMRTYEVGAAEKYREWIKEAGKRSEFPWTVQDTSTLLGVVWAMVRDGLFFPYPKPLVNSSFNITLILTSRGVALLQEQEEDPLHPGFSAKFRAIVKDNESLARIEDAAQCLSKGLFRPAVVMMGLAVETTISILHRGLCEHLREISKPKQGMAKELLDAIETYVGNLPNKGNKDKKVALKRAITVAHDLRGDRNASSHPGEVPLTRGEVEDLFRGASRAIMRFWEHGIHEFWADFDKGPYTH